MPRSDYHPVDCGFHDLLELLALRRSTCEVVFLAEEGTPRSIRARVLDVFSAGSEEFILLEGSELLDGGERIRLDRLLSVAGTPRPGARMDADSPGADCSV